MAMSTACNVRHANGLEVFQLQNAQIQMRFNLQLLHIKIVKFLIDISVHLFNFSSHVSLIIKDQQLNISNVIFIVLLRQLSVERESLAANLEKESRKVKRLSMEKEELMWKVNNSNSLSLSSPSLNIDIASPNRLESTPCSSRSFTRSVKTQSLYLPTLDDEDYTVL